MPVWRKLLLFGAGFGAGLALATVAAVGFWNWYAHRPRPDPAWNASSIKAEITGISYEVADSFVVTFQYKLSNATDKDYSMPQDSARVVMTKLPADNGYARGSAVMNDDVFVPAHDNANVDVLVSFDYSDSYPRTAGKDHTKMVALLKTRLKELDGFAIFDRVNHYKIEFPSPGTFGNKIAQGPHDHLEDLWTPVEESPKPARQR